MRDDETTDSIKDKCAVFGVTGEKRSGEMTYHALHNMQHRGQETSGIVTFDGESYHYRRSRGIVNEGYSTKDFEKRLTGETAIGHVRYSTKGNSEMYNAQPFIENDIAIAHNGEIANYNTLKKILKQEGAIFQSESDTEIFLKLLHRESGNLEEKIMHVGNNSNPSYSMVFMGEKKLIGLRDSAGVRPLELGKTRKGYALASESTAFDIIGARHLREVRPGEMIVLREEEEPRSYFLLTDQPERRCIFEQIYFSRPDSMINEETSIGMIRREFGKELFRENPHKTDVVIDVPDSSFDAAIGYSRESGIPYDRGLIRSHYIARTFIQPSQELRDVGVLKKFNINKPVTKDKKITLVDDSLVRGTTMKSLVQLLKEKGKAKEVHVLISSPPYTDPCYLGVDTSNKERLIARQKSVEDIRQFIKADSLNYLTKEGMLKNPLLRGKGFCTYCFDGIEEIKKE